MVDEDKNLGETVVDRETEQGQTPTFSTMYQGIVERAGKARAELAEVLRVPAMWPSILGAVKEIAADRDWQPIETAPPYKTLLTIHQDDLYPVCAFYFDQDGKRFWMRTIEGPEDIIRPEQGDHCELYRAPTHWMLPPDPPCLPISDETQPGQAS